MTKRIIVLMLILLVVAVAIFVLWMALAEQELTVYDPRSFEPYGFKAVYSLLEKAGYSIKVTETLGAYDAERELLMITVKSKFSEAGRRKIMDWVFRGGTVLELAHSKPLFYTAAEKPVLMEVNPHKRFCRPVRELGVKLKYYLGGERIYTARRGVQGLVAQDGRFIGYIEDHGAGRIIHWNDPDGLTNIIVGKFPDNAVLFALLVKEYIKLRRIVFCYNPRSAETPESGSGVQTNRFWTGGWLLLAAVGLLLWKLAVRFGRPRPLILAKGRSADEFIYSMAALFQQADLKIMVLDNLYKRLVRAILKISGLPARSDWVELNEYLAVRLGKEYAQKVNAAVALYRQFQQDQKITKAGFIELAGLLDQYRKELTAWKM